MRINEIYSSMLLALACVVSTLADSPIDLGQASSYAILAASTITSTGVLGTQVNGNMGVSPGTAVTGFPPAILVGTMNLGNGASLGAQGDLTVAYNVAAGKNMTTSLSNVDLGGMTLLPGVYNWAGAASMNGMLTLDAGGDPDAVWTFQVGSSLLIGAGSSVIFKNSVGNPDYGNANYVYWQVGSSATLSGDTAMQGNIMAFNSIWVSNGATINGRLLACNAAVTLDYNTVTIPYGSTVSKGSKYLRG